MKTTHRDAFYRGVFSLGENKNPLDGSQWFQGSAPRNDVFPQVQGIDQLAAQAFLVP
tara:strand:- start:1496 stop:1666 length:171 start_codon:yes stop_codon:yes gene_type:complete